MDTQLIFIVPDSLKSVVQAAGIPAQVPDVTPCALLVGDVLSYEAVPGLAFRIAARWFCAASDTTPARWYLTIEKTAHPLDVPLSPPLR